VFGDYSLAHLYFIVGGSNSYCSFVGGNLVTWS